MKKLLFLFALAVLMSSCYNTRLLVGNVKATDPLTEVNSVWTHHFILGLVPGKNATMDVEDIMAGRENYMIKTNMTFLNGLVGGLTLGIYTPTQTTYYVPLNTKELQ